MRCEVSVCAATLYLTTLRSSSEQSSQFKNTFSDFSYFTELFPTVVRGEGHSATAFASNFLTLGVPFVVFLGYQYMVLPLLIFGSVCLLAAVTALFLPETANVALPQTLEDGELMGKDMRWSQIFSFSVPQLRQRVGIVAPSELHQLQERTQQKTLAGVSNEERAKSNETVHLTTDATNKTERTR